VSLPLDRVEPELARLWAEEARRSQAARVELLTLVALVSELGLLERARAVIDDVVREHPSRTIVAAWTDGGPPSITADVVLHRCAGEARGDAITLHAVGGAREWLPENVDRLALPGLPVCVWWVGDLPDFDDLFDRMVVGADLVVVDSGEMDLRDLEKLSSIVARSRGRYALADLTWMRLRWLQDLVARFFDDEAARACLAGVQRITIEFAPRPDEQDVASTTAGLLFGWMANALRLPLDEVRWTRCAEWGEVAMGPVVARFERRSHADVRPGSIMRVSIESAGGRFDIERQDDPQVFRWSTQVHGAPSFSQTFRVHSPGEAALLVRTLERPGRDRLLERSLQVASRIVRPVAPRLSSPPPARG
jgi:glucose-6-phosphate dehydrogenase assembly protein OpcA